MRADGSLQGNVYGYYPTYFQLVPLKIDYNKSRLGNTKPVIRSQTRSYSDYFENNIDLVILYLLVSSTFASAGPLIRSNA